MPFESSGCDVIDSTFNTTKPTRRIELQLSIHPDLVSFIAIESAAIKWKKGTKKKQNKRRAPPRSQDEERGVLIGYDDSSYLNMAPVNIEPTGTDAYWHRSRFSVVVVFFSLFRLCSAFCGFSLPFPPVFFRVFSSCFLSFPFISFRLLHWLVFGNRINCGAFFVAHSFFLFLVVPFLNFFGSSLSLSLPIFLAG